jgi:hypothetical protein
MLGYALGRIGWQISGDGDWGIPANMALKPTWLPQWTWAQTYNHNILGIAIPSPGVYPTPLYEVVNTVVNLFGIAATQAQFISVALIAAGSAALWILGRRPVTASIVR